MTVVVITVNLKPEVDAHEFADHYVDLIRESGRDTGEVVEVTYEGVLEEPTTPPHKLWCPVCGAFHEMPIGEKTDAGVATRACPRVPTDNPCYYGSPIYTGDRG